MPASKTKKIVDETHELPKRLGGGILRRLVWVDVITGRVTKYSLVYINPMVYAMDNGRVLGFDNDHNYHHMHYMGKVKPIEFKSFEAIEETFETEFKKIIEDLKK